MGLVEVKVRENNCSPIIKNMFKSWVVEHNCQPNSISRIWVAWNPNIFEGQVLSCSEQSITCKIKFLPPHSEDFILTVVYGFNEKSRRREL